MYILMSLLDRYLLKEIIVFFLFSVGLFSSLGVTLGTLSDLAYKVTEYNLPIKTAIEIFLLNIPEFVAYALPISVLLATLLTYGSLSNNSELIAFRSVGISIYRLIIPALLFAFIVTNITFFFNEFVVSIANEKATILQGKYMPKDLLDLQKQNLIYPEYQIITPEQKYSRKRLKRLFYAQRFDGKVFHGLTILNWSEDTLTQIITCETAQWNEHKNVWDLFQVEIEYLDDRNTKHFNHQQFPFTKALLAFAKQDIDLFEMNIFQAQNYLDIIKVSGDRKKTLLFQVRIQQKIAFPFICLVFACIGSMVGISSQHINRVRGFGLCICIVFSYYLLAFLMGALGLLGTLSPFLAAWLPNFFGFTISGWLLIQK